MVLSMFVTTHGLFGGCQSDIPRVTVCLTLTQVESKTRWQMSREDDESQVASPHELGLGRN